MSSNFRIRHGQPDLIGNYFEPAGPVQVFASNYSTIAVGHHYPPNVQRTTKGPVVRYSDRTYFHENGDLRRTAPKDRTISSRQRRIAARKARQALKAIATV